MSKRKNDSYFNDVTQNTKTNKDVQYSEEFADEDDLQANRRAREANERAKNNSR